MSAKEKKQLSSDILKKVQESGAPGLVSALKEKKFNILDWHKIILHPNRTEYYESALKENTEIFNHLLHKTVPPQEIDGLKALYLYPLLRSTIRNKDGFSFNLCHKKKHLSVKPEKIDLHNKPSHTQSALYASLSGYERFMLKHSQLKHRITKYKTSVHTARILYAENLLESLLNKITTNEPATPRIISYSPAHNKNNNIPILLSSLLEVPRIERAYLQEAPARLRAGIFREGLTRQIKKLSIHNQK
ncbi:hypothetical protein NEIG_00819 [Nematocida sp. ERTm5]|nr:hypothetical protein NEIRO02_0491 [Nematocida sp. AWRm79]KAI5182808.1 hypothetical protein NEIRO03_0450 [Nematocida sp. AWRm78]OAG31519.1 hypothetical protein NEIG_00819 [Nematocida sp. ERTm5]